MKINGFSYNELFKLSIKKPLLAQIELTRNCNQSCKFCFRHCSPKKIFKDLPIDKWKIAIKYLINLGIEELNFSGGEIFLYQNINQLLSYAKFQGIKKITVNTNGQTNLKLIDFGKIDEIVFSIHDLNNKHDLIVGKIGAFELIENNLKHIANKYNGLIGINTVVCQENIDNLKNIYNKFKKLNINYHAFNFNVESKLNHGNEFKKNFKKYLNFLKTIPPERRKLRHGMQNIIKDNIKPSLIQLPDCAAGKYKLIIDFEGNVYPCRFYQQNKFFCGNIFQQKIKDIWKNGKGFKFFRKIFSKKPNFCLSCRKINKCAGGCLMWRLKGINERDVRCEIGDAYFRA